MLGKLGRLLTLYAGIIGFSTSAYSEPMHHVFFENLKDGETVSSPVDVKMGVSGMKIGPAGTIEDGIGHHHLIIDGDSIKKGDVVPSDENHLHFGKGQTETELKLSPGMHTLTLQFADGAHQSYGKDWSDTIHVIVR